MAMGIMTSWKWFATLTDVECDKIFADCHIIVGHVKKKRIGLPKYTIVNRAIQKAPWDFGCAPLLLGCLGPVYSAKHWLEMSFYNRLCCPPSSVVQ
eukprot:scaffold14319_cov148-Skeletonema_menzelii.AAC.4